MGKTLNWEKLDRENRMKRYGASGFRGDDADQWLTSSAASFADTARKAQHRLNIKALADIHDMLKRRETFAWRRRLIEQSVMRLKAAGVLVP